ncbi:MAG: hypothetical protein ACYDB5_07485 [bacterium]
MVFQTSFLFIWHSPSKKTKIEPLLVCAISHLRRIGKIDSIRIWLLF